MKRLVLFPTLFACAAALALWGTSLALTPHTVRPAQAPLDDSAVVQVYGADVWGVRGYFAIHTWIATRARGAGSYDIYQVIGWQLRRTGSAVSITKGNPARPWFRSPAMLLHEVHGEKAASLIDRIHDAALAYPYAKEYVMWPGPNSNSFTAWIALQVPELGLDLPMKAIGKGWMIDEYPSLVPQGAAVNQGKDS